MIGHYILITGLAVLFFYPDISVLNRIEEGIAIMADANEQAVADLTAAVAGISDAVAAATAVIAAEIAKAKDSHPDVSAAVEEQVGKLNSLAAALKDASAPPAA